MTSKQKKNLIWLVAVIVLATVITVRWLQHREMQIRLQEQQKCAHDAKEARRLFNAQAMRASGVGGHALILDGSSHLSPNLITEVAQMFIDRFGEEILVEDVAMWVDEGDVKLVLTSDKLYCVAYGELAYWKLADLKTVDWQRTTGGYVEIGEWKVYILLDYRKPFVEAMRKILLNCQPKPSAGDPSRQANAD